MGLRGPATPTPKSAFQARKDLGGEQDELFTLVREARRGKQENGIKVSEGNQPRGLLEELVTSMVSIKVGSHEAPTVCPAFLHTCS